MQSPQARASSDLTRAAWIWINPIQIQINYKLQSIPNSKPIQIQNQSKFKTKIGFGFSPPPSLDRVNANWTWTWIWI